MIGDFVTNCDYLFFQDWALGVLHTKIICAVTMMGPQWWLKRVIEQVSKEVYTWIDQHVKLLPS